MPRNSAISKRRLYGELLERLQEERDLQRRAAAYRFPQQFRGLGPLIEQFLDAAFIGVPGAPEPMLRGVYFTSGTQEGSPIDRVLGALARSFKLERGGAGAGAGPAVAGSGKSFFLTRLLREVIFPGIRAWPAATKASSGARGGCACSPMARSRRSRVALAVLWTASFIGNREFVAAAQAKAGAAKEELAKLGPPQRGDEAQLVRALNALRDAAGGYRDRQGGVVAVPDVGLSQAGKIGAQALRAYRNALRDALFPRLALALEAGSGRRCAPGQDGLRETWQPTRACMRAGNPIRSRGGRRAAHLAASRGRKRRAARPSAGRLERARRRCAIRETRR